MSPFFTRRGDEGQTGILGKNRLSKDDAQIELLGNLDELSSSIGLARSATTNLPINDILLQIQRDLFGIMSEAAADDLNKEKFQFTSPQKIQWLEDQISFLELNTSIPSYFILSGDSQSSSFLDLARTITRRAERRAVSLSNQNRLANPAILKYLNRLSSLIFVLELNDLQQAGLKPTSANKDKQV